MSTERFSRVLVVEDNPVELGLLREIMQDEGFQVIGCGSAREALEQVNRIDFGAAVVDLRLPDLSGAQLLQHIREADSQIRVIIYTGTASYDSIKEAMNLGAFAYVEKLSDPSELMRHIRRACLERVDRYATDLEQAVAKRTSELARSNEELENFASVVAHDLRSPLLTISGYCQLLQEEYGEQLESTAKEYINQIVAGSNRMSRLIEDVFEYSRAGRCKESLQQVDLESVLTQACANLESTIKQNDAQLEISPLPTVAGDHTQLVRLFQNLVGNAIKFRRSEPPVIRISAVPDNGWWRFAVADNGIGVAKEEFDHIFQIFHRPHGREYPGSGIGLAVCKKIVERHGGRIWLESEVGRGATFYFTLPTVA